MKKPSWYEKYLPFVSRSPEMQIRWLEAALRKGALSRQEITPYVRLLLNSDGGDEHLAILRDLVAGLDGGVIDRLLLATEVYDMPIMFGLLSAPTLGQAVIAITRDPPPYEKTPLLVVDKVFQAVYDSSEELLGEAAALVMGDPACPAHFPGAYERFKEIKEDEKLLSALYPKAVV